jgi:sec-independent protein translocase protein TatB
VFENLGWWEIALLALLGLFILGPERLPKVIADAARLLRTVRRMARSATEELREELGTDIDLADLHPKTFVRKHLLSEDDEEALRRPIRDAMRDFDEIRHVDDVADAHASTPVERAGGAEPDGDRPARKPSTRYDSEAT